MDVFHFWPHQILYPGAPHATHILFSVELHKVAVSLFENSCHHQFFHIYWFIFCVKVEMVFNNVIIAARTRNSHDCAAYKCGIMMKV